MRKLTFAAAALVLAGLVGCQSKENTSLKIYVNQKLYDKAIQQATLALKTSPQNGDTYYFLGVAYYGKDQELKPEAEGYADSAASFLQKAFADFMQAKKLTPEKWGKAVDDGIVSMFGRHYNRGIIAFKRSDFAAASAEYRLATLADPENYQGYYAHAGALLQLAGEARKNKDEGQFTSLTDVIIQDLKKVIDLKPTDKDVLVSTHQTLGDVLYKRGDLKGAQEGYAQAVALDPENYTLLITMAARFYDEQDWENASTYLANALSIKERLKLIDKDDCENYASLGSALSKLNRRDEAIAAYTKALDKCPNDQTMLFNIMVSHYKTGEALDRDGKGDEAKESYNKGVQLGNELIRIDPNKPDYYQVLAYCYRGLGDTGSAARYLKKFNELKAQGQRNP